MSDAALADLRARLVRAAGTLSAYAALSRTQDEVMRLEGKAAGVALALSYLDEYLPRTP